MRNSIYYIRRALINPSSQKALGDPGSAESLHSTMPLEIAAGQATAM